MFNKLRNYSKIIIIIVVIAMVITGALYGFGAFNFEGVNRQSYNIASVNGTNISEQQYYSILANQSGINYLTRDQEIPFKYNVLNSIINTELLLQEADNLNIKSQVTDEDINEHLNMVLENNQITEEELIEILKNSNISFREYKREIRKMLDENNRLTQVREQSYSDIIVSEEEIIEAYEELELELIVKEFNDDKENARKVIEEALNKINSGEEFAVVAEKYTDYFQVNVGIKRNNSILPSSITENAFTIEKGYNSEIIEGEDAYYLLKVVDKKVASGEDYEKAKDEIKENLLNEKQNTVFSNWLKNLRQESEISINDPSLSGYEALINGNYSLAIAEFEKALELYSTPMTYIYLAESYLSNDETNNASEIMSKAIEEYPQDWELHYYYAMLLSTNEDADKEESINLLDQASNLAGDDLMAHYQLYMAYGQLGEEEKADLEIKKINDIQAMIQEAQKVEEQNTGDSNEAIEETEIEENTDSTSGE